MLFRSVQMIELVEPVTKGDFNGWDPIKCRAHRLGVFGGSGFGSDGIRVRQSGMKDVGVNLKAELGLAILFRFGARQILRVMVG